jgi:hypothetical protein
MMKKLAAIGICAVILLGTAMPANAKSGAAAGGMGFAGGHGASSSASGHGGNNAGRGSTGHGGPVGFANGQPPPACQPGVCPGRTQ